MPAALPLELLLCDLPAPSPDGRVVRVGVQLRDEVRETAAFAGKDEIAFSVQLQVGMDPLRFKGPAVQGPGASPFLYLSWGDWVEGAWSMAARTKIPLSSLPLPLLEAALAGGKGLRARLSLTDPRGRLVTGSLKPAQIAWSLAE